MLYLSLITTSTLSTLLLLLSTPIVAVVEAIFTHTDKTTLERNPLIRRQSEVKHSVNITGVSATTILEFYGTINVGTPPKPIKMVFETGAYRTWIKNYDGQGSSSFTPTRDIVSSANSEASSDSSADNGIVRGPISIEKFDLSPSLGIGNVSFVQTDQTTGNENSGFDGVLGLGFTPDASLNNGSPFNPSFFDVLRSTPSANLENPIVSYSLNEDGDNGEILFGTVDKTKYQGELTWIPHKPIKVSPESNTTAETADYLWSVGINTITVGNERITFGSGGTAVLATGTSIVFMPKVLADQVGKGVGGTYDQAKSRYSIPCSSLGTMPNMTFSFQAEGGQSAEFVLTPYDYSFSYDTSQELCFVGVFESSDKKYSESVLLGNMFLRQVYSVFDYERKSIGIANRVLSEKGGRSVGNGAMSMFVWSPMCLLLVVAPLL